MEPHGIKRLGPSITTDSFKRRAPYTLRACSACRRRKGKCDGKRPCGTCDSRDQACKYDDDTTGDRQQSALQEEPVRALNQPRDPSRSEQSRSASVQPSTARIRPADNEPTVVQLDGAHTSGFIMSEALAFADGSGPGSTLTSVSGSEPVTGRETSNPRTSTQVFYGPTSADYSINLVRKNLRERGYAESSHHHLGMQRAAVETRHLAPLPWQPTQHCDRQQLLHFRHWLTFDDASDVLATYQNMVGVLHPFVDIGHIQGQLRLWYCHGVVGHSDTGCDEPDDDDLIILVLMLAIAAQAQTDTIHAKMASVLFFSFQHAANAAVASGKASIKQARIVLLLGYYYFYHDLPRLAQRMCGTAGRILMELGYHNDIMLKQGFQDESQLRAASIMMSSVMILDRQWSAMTGLPANFAQTTFNPSPEYLVDAPFTSAMIKLLRISDKFDEPINLAVQDSQWTDDDTLELLVFQIQQWQRKSIGDLTLSDRDVWFSEPANLPPSWALLVIFRAASIRSLLLRPCFLPTSDISRSQDYFLPALELVQDVTAALVSLDSTTSVYRDHRPYYQHILASICALMFLINGFIDEHREDVIQYVPLDYEDRLRRCYVSAKALSEKYACVSRAAHTLWKRIQELCHAMETSMARRSTFDTGANSTAPTRAAAAALEAPATHNRASNPSSAESPIETVEAMQFGDFEFDPWSFSASLDLDFMMDGNFSQGGPSGWQLGTQGYVFQ